MLLSGIARASPSGFCLVELCFQRVQPRDVRDRFVSTPGIGFFRFPPVASAVRHAGDFDHIADRVQLVITAEGVGLKVTVEAFQES